MTDKERCEVSEADMKAALHAYIDGFNAGDADAISAFYRQGVGYVTHMALSAPIRGSHANAAAMAFEFEMEIQGRRSRTSAIDVMEFNDLGKIRRMRAYWGPSDHQEPDSNG